MLAYLAVAPPAPGGGAEGGGCGIGYELGVLLPVLMRLRRRARG
jgi:hypothetical protein